MSVVMYVKPSCPYCQAAREQNVECQCAALSREHAGEKENDDVAWRKGKDYGDEFYGDLIRLHNGSDAVKKFADHSVDLLLLDDCDSGAQIRADLSLWESKLAPNGLVLIHGIALERVDDPKAAWLEWTTSANRGISGRNWTGDHVATGGSAAPGTSLEAVIRKE